MPKRCAPTSTRRRRVLIPKPDGKQRPLGIATIRDRVVQTACKLVLEPIIEPHLHLDSYGYRSGRRAQDAVSEIEASLKVGYRYVADLSAYFDTIPQERLLDKLARHINDQNCLALIRRWLRAPVQIEQDGKVNRVTSTQGTQQGSPLSPLLANLYQNDFCRLIAERTPCRIVVYADDFVILHRQPYTEEQVEWMAKKLDEEGLTINREKTQVVDMNVKGAAFDFLGFSFKRVRGYYPNTEYVKVQPSKKSMKRFKDRIRQIVKHRTPLTLEQLIDQVNPIIRGWRNYFTALLRWSRRLSQRGSKRLAQNAWEVLRKAGLQFLQPVSRPSL